MTRDDLLTLARYAHATADRLAGLTEMEKAKRTEAEMRAAGLVQEARQEKRGGKMVTVKRWVRKEDASTAPAAPPSLLDRHAATLAEMEREARAEGHHDHADALAAVRARVGTPARARTRAARPAYLSQDPLVLFKNGGEHGVRTFLEGLELKELRHYVKAYNYVDSETRRTSSKSALIDIAMDVIRAKYDRMQNHGRHGTP